MCYGCSLCSTVAMYVFVVWLVPRLLMEKDTSIKPLTGLCRVWDCQNTSNFLRMNLSAGMHPLVLCRGWEEMQGRRVLTAREAHGVERLGIVLPIWGSRAFMEHGPSFWPGAEVPFANEKATLSCFSRGITIYIWPFSPPNAKDSSVTINGSSKMDFLSTDLGECILIKGQQWLLKTESKGVGLFKKPDAVQCNEMFWKAW